MKRLRQYLILLMIGAVAFWLPDLLIHAIVSPFSRLVPLFNTIVCSWCFYWVLRHWAASWAGRKSLAALAMCAGVWLLGPLLLSLSFWIGVGNFAGRDLAWYALFPFTVATGSNYDGTLFALILITAYTGVLLFIEGITFLRHRMQRRHASSSQMTQ